MCTKTAHGFDDLIGGLGPDEGLRILVVLIEIVHNGAYQLPRAAMASATDLFACENREPTLHEIEPRRAGRCKVKMKTGMLDQPPFDRGCLVRCVIV